MAAAAAMSRVLSNPDELSAAVDDGQVPNVVGVHAVEPARRSDAARSERSRASGHVVGYAGRFVVGHRMTS